MGSRGRWGEGGGGSAHDSSSFPVAARHSQVPLSLSLLLPWNCLESMLHVNTTQPGVTSDRG